MSINIRNFLPLILVASVVLLGGIVLFIFRSTSIADSSINTTRGTSSPAIQPHKESALSQNLPQATTKIATSVNKTPYAARDIFIDKDADLRSRFSALSELADK